MLLLARYPVAIFLALFVHIALLALLVRVPNEVPAKTFVQPKAIKASLVQLEKPKPKAVKKKPIKKKPEPKPVKPKPVEKKVDPEKVVPLKKQVEPRVEEVPEPDQDESMLDQLLTDEASELQAEEDLNKVQRYSLAVENQVYRRWSRPPSARNNMVVLLSIRLLPSGDIVGVSIKESSNNDALDRSAVSAVKQVRQFDFVREMEPRFFETYFREFELRFSPQDMRL